MPNADCCNIRANLVPDGAGKRRCIQCGETHTVYS